MPQVHRPFTSQLLHCSSEPLTSVVAPRQYVLTVAPRTVALCHCSRLLQEVCIGDAYIDKFIVSQGTATIDPNSTRAFRAKGILSVQGRCSDGRQLGYYGPSPSDTSVSFLQENIAVESRPVPCPSAQAAGAVLSQEDSSTARL